MPVQMQLIRDYKDAIAKNQKEHAEVIKSKIFQQISTHLKESPKFNQSKTFQETIMKTWRDLEVLRLDKKKSSKSQTLATTISLFHDYVKEHNLPIFYKVEEIMPGDIYIEKGAKNTLMVYQYLYPKEPDDEYTGDWWGIFLDSDPINGKMRIDKPKKILVGIHVPSETIYGFTKFIFFFFNF